MNLNLMIDKEEVASLVEFAIPVRKDLD